MSHYVGLREGDREFAFETPEEARAYASIHALYGYRALDEAGKTAYLPYSELACDILREAKIVADLVRTERFRYGHAPLNPAFDHAAHIVSCDRFVDWALFRVGFTDQPFVHGKCVSGPGLTDWCVEQGFTKIESLQDALPGDIVFVRPDANYNPLHTFLLAGAFGGEYFRYDCGSNKRIQSVQPFLEPINDFMYAYRPVKKANA